VTDDQTGHRPVILFDGVCNLCNASVQFVIRRDPGDVFRFASLQSPAGRTLLQRHGLPADQLASIVLVDGDRCLVKSDAALRIARALRWPWPLLGAASIVPRTIRDRVYEYVARNRYRWFGKRDSCSLPTGAVAHRFLE
jgi:predicted DCC family thiol-disulfide oxidoreductase YuxK